MITVFFPVGGGNPLFSITYRYMGFPFFFSICLFWFQESDFLEFLFFWRMRFGLFWLGIFALGFISENWNEIQATKQRSLEQLFILLLLFWPVFFNKNWQSWTKIEISLSGFLGKRRKKFNLEIEIEKKKKRRKYVDIDAEIKQSTAETTETSLLKKKMKKHNCYFSATSFFS